jgi:hypothetical protein
MSLDSAVSNYLRRGINLRWPGQRLRIRPLPGRCGGRAKPDYQARLGRRDAWPFKRK